MKFIHTGDWHIGAAKSYIPDAISRTLSAIENIYKLALARSINTVVVAGDIFDSSNVSSEEKRELAYIILKYDEVGIKTLMIPGNHDKNNEKFTTIDYLAVLTKFDKYKTSYVTEQTSLVVVDGFGFLLFTGEPWKDLAKHIGAITLGSMDLGLLGLIVVAHVTIKGAVTTTGFALETGTEFRLSDNVMYYALGDIHLRQRIAKSTYYAGSPLQINFGELGPCGVLIVDTDAPDNPEFVEIESSQLVTIHTVDQEIPKNAFARIVYTDKVPETTKLPEGIIKIQWRTAEVDLSGINGDETLFSELDEILNRHGLSKEEVTMAKDMLNKTIIKLGD